MKAEAHVWVVECLQKSGKWKPVYSLNIREFARKEAQWRTNHFEKEHRIRKYVRPPPCGSEGKPK